MEKFISFNPVKLYFGKGVIASLPGELKNRGKNILLIYGKGSILKNGIYQEVIKQIDKNSFNISEYSGIKPNPVVDDVIEMIRLGREKETDVIVAIGGGSVIDSGKVVSACLKENIDPWKLMKGKIRNTSSVPLISVLTVAATGTEMNPYAVLQNHITNEKIGSGNPFMFPVASFLDPAFTTSVSAEQTSYGISDIIAHCFESYFGFGETTLTDRFITEIISETMEYAPLLLNNLNDYALREKIMWNACCALNGMTMHGKKSGDWGVHDIGHTISLLYDIPHGVTLSVAYPAWFRLMRDRIPEKISYLGRRLFNETDPDTFISKMTDFYKSINCPVKLSECGIDSAKAKKILDLMIKNEVNGMNHVMDADDLQKIVEFME